jgi:hypothetical protein
MKQRSQVMVAIFSPPNYTKKKIDLEGHKQSRLVYIKLNFIVSDQLHCPLWNTCICLHSGD